MNCDQKQHADIMRRVRAAISKLEYTGDYGTKQRAFLCLNSAIEEYERTPKECENPHLFSEIWLKKCNGSSMWILANFFHFALASDSSMSSTLELTRIEFTKKYNNEQTALFGLFFSLGILASVYEKDKRLIPALEKTAEILRTMSAGDNAGNKVLIQLIEGFTGPIV